MAKAPAAKGMFTPRGEVAGFTAIQKPALNFNKDGNEYQIKVAFDATPELAAFMAKLEELMDAKFQETLEADPKLKRVLKKADLGAEEMDDNGDPTGRTIIRFKQVDVITGKNKKGEDYEIKKSVGLFDSRGKAIKQEVRIGAGSEVKVSFEPYAYYTPKDKQVGISFSRLLAVQLIKLVEYTGSGPGTAEDYGFGDEGEDGGFDASEFTADQDTDDDTDQTGTPDF